MNLIVTLRILFKISRESLRKISLQNISSFVIYYGGCSLFAFQLVYVSNSDFSSNEFVMLYRLNAMTCFVNFFKFKTDVFRIHSNIQDGGFCENNLLIRQKRGNICFGLRSKCLEQSNGKITPC